MKKMTRWMKVEKFFSPGNKISTAVSLAIFQVGIDRSRCLDVQAQSFFPYYGKKDPQVIPLPDGLAAGFSANSQQLSV